MTIPDNDSRRRPPYKTVGTVSLVLCVLVLVAVYLQFRGDIAPTTQLTMMASRAGLVMDRGSKVTYNGVQIGWVADVVEQDVDGAPAAKVTLNVDPKYIDRIPSNVDATIAASTVFGNKYVSFASPKDPTPQRITSGDVIDVRSVTTEENTLFETITQIATRVDPVKLNATLTAAALALDGSGTKFGQSMTNGNDVLADWNPQMPQLQHDTQRLADLADIYTNASPDLWAFLNNGLSTAHTFNDQQGNVDATLLAAIGFGHAGSDILNRGGPGLVRGQADLVPTSQLSDEYSPEIFCTIRNYHDQLPASNKLFGGNGYSLRSINELVGAANPYVYPDNLPRTNARGGPEGRPGCWAPITRDLWPAPYLVIDSGASNGPYNHIGLGQPLLTDYIWGRQVGENTINP